MPPKVKITKEDIVQAGLEIVRRDGETGLNARSIAAVLGCSTQPVFSNYDSMDELRLAVLAGAEGVYVRYMQQEIASGKYPDYKASGMAYIRFAKEEKNLFRMLYMRHRTYEQTLNEAHLFDQMEEIVQESTGLERDRARLFHLEMWAFVHGIAAMMATGYQELDMELVSTMITDAYQGLNHRFQEV